MRANLAKKSDTHSVFRHFLTLLMLFNPDAEAAASARKSRRDGAQRPSKRGVRAVQTVCLDGSYQCRSLPTHNRLIINHLPICRLLACKRRSFTTQKAAFCTPKDGLLDSSAVWVYRITVSYFVFMIAFHVLILLQVRRPVTVMPHADAASSVCNQFRLAHRVFSLIELLLYPTDLRMTRKRRGNTWPDVRRPSAT